MPKFAEYRKFGIRVICGVSFEDASYRNHQNSSKIKSKNYMRIHRRLIMHGVLFVLNNLSYEKPEMTCA